MMIDLRTVKDDDPRLRALVWLVAAWRPSWDQPGIRAALHACRQPGRSLEQLQSVALATAQDVEARTPAAINHSARWDSPVSDSRAPLPLAAKCARCGVLVTSEEHRCYRPAQLTEEKRAEIAAALAEARKRVSS